MLIFLLPKKTLNILSLLCHKKILDFPHTIKVGGIKMNHKNILIIGGTGSLGVGLIKELLASDVASIKVFARNEHKMFSMQQTFLSPKIDIVIGDIKEKDSIDKACKDIDIIYHLAALKHVPICEKMPNEAIATNILGTKNVIDAAIKNQVKHVVFASTDKAVNPDCTYGTSKLMGEKMILSANAEPSNTKFTVFRGGNLLNSAGSVIPLFEKQIDETQAVTLTDEKMSRFFLSIQSAAKMMIEISLRSAGGEIFIPRMPQIKVKDIAKYLLNKKEVSDTNISIIGLRPGEKVKEQIISENEKEYLFEFSKELYVVLKNDNHRWEANHIVKKYDLKNETSKKELLSYEEATIFLKQAGV